MQYCTIKVKTSGTEKRKPTKEDEYGNAIEKKKAEEEQIHDKFLYGEEPSENDQTGSPINRIRLVKYKMAGIPTEAADSSKPYRNIRDLK